MGYVMPLSDNSLNGSVGGALDYELASCGVSYRHALHVVIYRSLISRNYAVNEICGEGEGGSIDRYSLPSKDKAHWGVKDKGMS